MFNLLEKQEVGTIQLGEKVRVSDPCYNMDVWCAGNVENVLPGEYQCFVQKADMGEWGIRVSSIEVRHKDFLYIDPTEIQDFEVGVDSGQAGIYDLPYYEHIHSDRSIEDPWYERVCDLTGEHVPNPDYIPFDKSKFWKDDFLPVHCKYMLNCGKGDILLAIEEVAERYAKGEITIDELNKEIDKKDEELGEESDLRLEYLEAKMDYGRSHEGAKEVFRFCGKTIDGKGLVSASGDGDGGYTCFVGRNSDGKVVSIKVDYYYYDESEEEE